VSQKASHPTREALITTVVHMLTSKNPEDLKVEEVLAQSGISSGSLYHHFVDFSDLIDQAMVLRYSSDIDASIASLDVLVQTAHDIPSLASGLLATTVRTQAPDRHIQRFIRAQTMVRAATHEQFRRALAPEQKRLTEAIADVLRKLQAKGLFHTSIDPHAGSIFIQAYNLGLIVNDVAEESVNHEAYVAIVSRMLEKTFFAE
jgi:AcrR family transcriptional regulator